MGNLSNPANFFYFIQLHIKMSRFSSVSSGFVILPHLLLPQNP